MVAGGLLLLAGAGFLSMVLLIKGGEGRLREPKHYGEASQVEVMPQVLWNGDVYEYRQHVVNILCLGIDGRGVAEKNEDIGFGPRADSIYLAVLDLDQEKLMLLNISRDTMADIRIFDSMGKDQGLYPMQLGLQYANGDGLSYSCELTATAVSRLLEGIPIHGYCALYWNGVGELHDQLGPVRVWVSEELHQLDEKRFPESGLVELNREQAMVYVQGRDTQENGSNEVRSGRQQAYFQELFSAGKRQIKSHPLKVFSLIRGIEPYLVTDLDTGEILALASWMRDWEMDQLEIRNLPGESVSGLFQDEYWVYQEEKKELLLELFYEKWY